jgi:UDP-GlcNAc:undecaprenyl-phosphate GlcNAc-1-phosphate transferase
MNNQSNMIIFLVVFGVLATAFSLLLNGLFIKFSKNLGMRNVDEGTIRWGSKSKPALGGISFFLNFLFAITFYFMLSRQHSILENVKFSGLLLAVTIGFLVGLADDAYNTKPLLKFSAQLLCGVILCASGTYIQLFSSMFLNYVMTIFWIVGIMNSINMLDNMDAITTTVSISIILCALIVLSALNSFESIEFIILIGVLAALIGFLFYNWNPSKIYMGDTGSQFLGVLLGAIAITCFWNTPFDGNMYHSQTKQVILTVIVFIVPIVDTTTVTINRLLRGQSPFVGGKDHTTHHLSYAGFSDRQVALIMGIISMFSCLITVWVLSIDSWTFFQAALLTIYFLIIFGLLFYISKTKKAPSARQ